MHIGDNVITDHPDSRSNRIIRSYGIVEDVTKAGSVTIKMADGSIIIRPLSSIAVYIKPPLDWQELYQQQDVLSQPKRQMFFGGSRPKQKQN